MSHVADKETLAERQSTGTGMGVGIGDGTGMGVGTGDGSEGGVEHKSILQAAHLELAFAAHIHLESEEIPSL